MEELEMKKQISRRDFLKIAAAGMGVAALGACTPKPTPEPTTVATEPPTDAPTEAPPTEAPIVEVEVTTSGWPIDVKSADDIAADPNNSVYAEAVQAWLDQNPGVTLTKVAVNIWDPGGVPALVAGGTDCTFLFGPCVGGGWGKQEAINAFVQGMLADVSPFIGSHGLEAKCKPNIFQAWSNGSQVDGKYFCYPLNEYGPSADTFMYRKDWIVEKGLNMPDIGWSFNDYRALLAGLTDPANNIYGAGHPTWFLPFTAGWHGWDILTKVPVRDQPWHFTRDVSDPRWVQIFKAYREMLYVDKTVLSDVALGGGDGEYQNLFKNGQVGVARGNIWSFFASPTDATGLAAFADREGKAYGDMFGVAILPSGDGYQKSGGVDMWGPVSYSPNAAPEAVDKACGLVDWMFFDAGLSMTKKGIWDATKDPRAVFSAFLYMDGRQGEIYEGVPATPADAWGQDIVNQFTSFGDMPTEPQENKYYPGEANPAPADSAISDQLNLMATDPSDLDLQAMLDQGQADYVAQLPGFASSISEADFRAGAQAYYGDLNDFFKNNYPTFYERRFKPFYEGKVLPAIS